MESDPLLALASDSQRYGNVHLTKGQPQSEVLAVAVDHFKRAIGEARRQVRHSQTLSLNLSNELRVKQRLLDQEQRTTDRLIQDKKDLIMQLAESRERVNQLEGRLKQLETRSETPPPLPPKSRNTTPNIEQKSEQKTVMPASIEPTPPELPKKTRKPSTMIQRVKKKLP